MNMFAPYRFYLDSPIDPESLKAHLPSKYTLHIIAQGEYERAQALDTFDRALRSSGRLLVRQQDHVLLFTPDTPGVQIQTQRAAWRFVRELLGGVLKEALQDVSDLRAFLPVCDGELQTQELALLDDEGKTHTRVCVYNFRQGQQIHCFGITLPLRGYAKAHRKLVSALLEQGAHARKEAFDFYRVLGALDTQYSSKPHVPIISDAPVIETARAIAETYIQVARSNEAGIQADYDTEFLHDYRVSLRKVRSVLSLFKGVFAEEDTIRLKQAFTGIMQQTNRLRDLDVYLLDKKLYFSMVPASMHEGLHDMFASVAKDRRQQWKLVVAMLQSEAYQRHITELADLFTEAGGIGTGPQSAEASCDFACQKIWKRYRKVCKIARKITAATPDDAVHELRIHCKKLRYLMEFFSPLFPKKEIKRLVQSLRGLQDNLGRFNDFSVQQLSLQDFLQEHSAQQPPNMTLAESIGSLVTVLHQCQQEERLQVMEHFAHFDSATIRTSFQTLFTLENSS